MNVGLFQACKEPFEVLVGGAGSSAMLCPLDWYVYQSSFCWETVLLSMVQCDLLMNGLTSEGQKYFAKKLKYIL